MTLGGWCIPGAYCTVDVIYKQVPSATTCGISLGMLDLSEEVASASTDVSKYDACGLCQQSCSYIPTR